MNAARRQAREAGIVRPTSPAFEPFSLAEGDVRVWCLASDRLLEPTRQQRIRCVLAPHEREREAGLRFPRDRQTYLLTRALVRHALSACTGISPADLRFRTSAFGKPDMAVEHGDAHRVSFNVSHTEGLVALAVMRHGAIGIDAEKFCARAATLQIAQRFFAPAEVADLMTEPTALTSRFFRYWTLKESYVKARSVGLSVPLDEFAFRLGPSPGEIAFQAVPGDRAAAWKIWQLASAGHVLAVCAQRNGVPQRLLVHAIDPDWQCVDLDMIVLGESIDE